MFFYISIIIVNIFVVMISYYEDLIGFIGDDLGRVTEPGMKFSLDGFLIDHIDWFSYLVCFYVSFYLSFPIILIFYISIKISETYPIEVFNLFKLGYVLLFPMLIYISVKMNFIILSTTSGNLFDVFEFDPKLADFTFSLRDVYFGFSMLTCFMLSPDFLMSNFRLTAISIRFISVLISSGTIKVLPIVAVVIFIAYLLKLSYVISPDIDSLGIVISKRIKSNFVVKGK